MKRGHRRRRSCYACEKQTKNFARRTSESPRHPRTTSQNSTKSRIASGFSRTTWHALDSTQHPSAPWTRPSPNESSPASSTATVPAAATIHVHLGGCRPSTLWSPSIPLRIWTFNLFFFSCVAFFQHFHLHLNCFLVCCSSLPNCILFHSKVSFIFFLCFASFFSLQGTCVLGEGVM